MYCRKCGYQNAEDAKFCISCGEKLEQIETQTADSARNYFDSNNVQNNGYNNAPVKEKKVSGVAIASFLLSLAGLFFAGLICGILGLIFACVAFK